jgi:hypothetical protein
MTYTPLEEAFLERIRVRLSDLRGYLAGMTLSDQNHVSDFFKALAKIKEIQGNINNDLSYLACLLANNYLEKRLGLSDFDAAAKPQGAPGLDMSVMLPPENA